MRRAAEASRSVEITKWSLFTSVHAGPPFAGEVNGFRESALQAVSATAKASGGANGALFKYAQRALVSFHSTIRLRLLSQVFWHRDWRFVISKERKRQRGVWPRLYAPLVSVLPR